MILFILAAMAPGMFWIWFIYRRDRYEPEPVRLVAWAFFAGVISVVPALIMELIFNVGPLINAALIAPIAEEVSKFLAVFLIFYRKRDFNEAMDGLVYAGAVALGFATLENIGYLLSAAADGTFLRVSAARALLSVPGHFLFSTIWGYGLGMRKFGGKSRGFLLLTLAGAAAAHALFNFLLFNITWGAVFYIFLMVIIWSLFLKHSKRLQEMSFRRWKRR